MMLKSIVLFTVPLIVIIIAFSFLSNTKDPLFILNNAEVTIDEYTTESLMIMDLSVMDSAMRYVSNVTTAVLGDQIYTRIVTQTPFTDDIYVNEQFFLDEGNFSCTNSLLRPVCFPAIEEQEMPSEALARENYNKLEYLGSKQVNGVPCDAVSADINASQMQKLIGSGLEGNFSEIDSVFLYTCVDPVNGLSLESLWGISGKSTIGSLIIDIGLNITRKINTINYTVSESLFVLPYEVISVMEYEELVNQTNEYLSSQTV